MKISKSKQELARIISENDGWRDGAEWAAQDKLGPDAEADEVCFYSKRPESPSGAEMWNANRPSSSVLHHFSSNGLIAGWYQSCLSRAEYFHLYPVSDGVGEVNDKLDISNRLMDIADALGDLTCEASGEAWSRLLTYAPKETKTPAIERLAADYRSLKELADGKQAEADAAKADAEGKLAELVAAGKANGLVVSVADAEPVITDWRDLQVGDEVEYSHGGQTRSIGMVGKVVKFDYEDEKMRFRLAFDDGTTGWPTEWRFIRRP